MTSRGISKSFFLAVAAVLGLVQMGFTANAATNATTRALLTLAVNLTGELQQQTDSTSHSRLVTRTVTTRDMVLAVGAELGLGADQLTGAQLIQEIAPLNLSKPPTNSFFVLRTGGTNILISQLLRLSLSPTSLEVLTDRPNVDGTDVRTEYQVFQMSLTTSDLSFTVQGQTTVSSTSVSSGTGVTISRPAVPAALSMAAAGGGKINGKDIVLHGTVGLSARTVVTATSP
jgi:hypothetical protein